MTATARTSSASPEEVRAFVAACFTAFDRAFADHGEVDDLVVAGRGVRVRYAAPSLRARMRPALRHLAGPPVADPHLTICCWDGAVGAAALPRPPWRRIDFVGEARIRGHITGPLVATYDPDGRLFQLHDRPGGRALLHVAESRELPEWHDRAPFKAFFSLWADDARLALLHGATVGERGAAVVLAGGSGAGKSTTALACMLDGMDFLGDDACLVDAAARRVWSIYGHAKIEPDAIGRLGSIDRLGAITADVTGASVLSPGVVTESASLRAVLLVAVSGRRVTDISPPLARGPALAALADTLRVERKGLTPAAHAALATVVDAVAVRRLAVGTDPSAAVAAIRGVLR